MDRQREHARQRPQPERHDENQREHDIGHGAAEFEKTPGDENQEPLPVRFGEATKLRPNPTIPPVSVPT